MEQLSWIELSLPDIGSRCPQVFTAEFMDCAWTAHGLRMHMDCSWTALEVHEVRVARSTAARATSGDADETTADLLRR